jgi:hypothetical protein
VERDRAIVVHTSQGTPEETVRRVVDDERQPTKSRILRGWQSANLSLPSTEVCERPTATGKMFWPNSFFVVAFMSSDAD